MGKVEMVSIPKTTLETAETLEDLEDHKTAVKFREYQEEMFEIWRGCKSSIDELI